MSITNYRHSIGGRVYAILIAGGRLITLNNVTLYAWMGSVCNALCSVRGILTLLTICPPGDSVEV